MVQSEDFATNNEAAIPPNLVVAPNIKSNSGHLRYCKDQGIKLHTARFPASLPKFFVRMLINPGDDVVDPFGGSCVTGEVCERLERRWMCIDLDQDYLRGAKGRFRETPKHRREPPLMVDVANPSNHYKVPQPGLLWYAWYAVAKDRLPANGGRKRAAKPAEPDEA